MKFKSLLKNFYEWIKCVCFGFFHGGYARRSAKQGILGVLACIASAYVLICGGLTIGYNGSFSSHYKNASELKRTIAAALEGAKFTITDGKLNMDGADPVAEFSEDGYSVIVDTRPASSTYDDFEIICKGKDGGEISYESYLALKDGEKSKYSLSLKYTGKTLDISLKQDDYRAHLEAVSDKNAAGYDELVAATYADIKDREQSGALTGDELENEIYLLYVKSYYPNFGNNITVPVVRGYYAAKLNDLKSDKYFVLFEEYCAVACYSDDGAAVSFRGEYRTADGAVTDLDGLIEDAFDGTRGRNFLVFAANMIVSTVIFVVLTLLFTMLLARFYKKSGREYGSSSDLFNIACGFLPASGVVGFALGIALPYALNVNTAFLAVRLIVVGVILVRLAALVAVDYLADRKNKAASPVEDVAATKEVEPSDPFEADGQATDLKNSNREDEE